ncbi:Na/Pi cotransporter family protein [Butyrivibrio sp. MC2013]|uniref:Na/Pi cotransporter family protein n=1 Tax=Butyrivibrio sp. MC2013 TaxID=1280686 RepID=UPI00041A3380|nr:Na/Pi cotransporter family protein [Butyrivibrio sp. MC2013]
MNTTELFELIAGVVGGLALFLYGMNVMSGGLTKAAGGRLESTLAKVTSNRWLAYFFGIAITAVVQSSSASTVMVVGLVNSGIMRLAQSVNVILGANLGTTVTAWILSLNGIEGGNFFTNLLKPASFTPFLALAGVALFMFSKSEKKKNIGTVMVGFAVLMFGMSMMSEAVAPLKENQGFVNFLRSFSNPIIGFVVGVAFTMIIQSSAGTIGIVQAFAGKGMMTYGMVIPVVMGAEVGTCITAILSSVGAGKNGKRAALMHLYFNLLKAGTFMVGFYAINAFVHFAFLDNMASYAGPAIIHTLVNLVASPLMVPFSGLFVAMALKTIPIDEREQQEMEENAGITTLDDRFLANPPFALEQARLATVAMKDITVRALFQAIELIKAFDEEKAQEVEHMEKEVDRYEDQLDTYLMKVNTHHLANKDNQVLSILLHSISDIERISDHALNIVQVVRRMHENNRQFSAKAQEEIDIFGRAVSEIVGTTFTAFENNDTKLAKSVEPLEEVIDGIHMEVKRRHIRRLRKGKCTIDLGFDLSDIGTDYERIADHCSNIAVALIQVAEDGFDTHEYLEMVRAEKNQAFEQAVYYFENKYRLPKMKKSDLEEEDKVDSSFREDHPVLFDINAIDEAVEDEEEPASQTEEEPKKPKKSKSKGGKKKKQK